ncbi:MAG: hypothetical protein RMK29_19610 [Myxococcales bacterium]|nr:hypothetical protein [Myxococcota bacterium]MDW8283915.1 hypothetical protein [Myxococcales bacterium]
MRRRPRSFAFDHGHHGPGSPQAGCLPAPVGSAERTSRLAHMVQAMIELTQDLDLQTLTPRQRQLLRTRWHRGVPMLARALADVLADGPALLSSLPVGAEALREQAEAVRRLADLQAVLGRIAAEMADELLVARAALFDTVGQVMDAIQHLIEGPFLPQPERERLRSLATPALALREQRQKDILRVRRERAALRAAARAATSPT